jgi:hypothetical protein
MDDSTPKTGGHPDRTDPPGSRPAPERLCVEELLRTIRDPRTTTGAVLSIAEDRRWQTYYKVRQALVFRADLPLPVSMRLLTTLWWRDLARAAEDPRLYPPVRARAEQLLAEQSEELSPGERVSLARIASRALIQRFRDSRDPRVVRALLDNPRLYEEDVLLIARDDGAPAQVLSAVARNPRWGAAYAVKLALAQNPRCPSVDSLRSLRGLSDNDLRLIAASPQTPRLGSGSAPPRAEIDRPWNSTSPAPTARWINSSIGSLARPGAWGSQTSSGR